MSAARLLVVGPDPAYAAAIRDVLAAQLPDAAIETLEPAQLRTRPLVNGIVIDARAGATAGATAGAELVKKLRAMGFAGALVALADSADSADSGAAAPDAGRAALAAAGAAVTQPAMAAEQLVGALAAELERAGDEHAGVIMRARRLIAAGEIAQRFQHSLNNPLAGILAETQLLQLESLAPDQHAALERIVVLCRRIIDLGKTLDGMSERK